MTQLFDIVIFDEASQCFTERGIPAMYRGKQLLVAGDDKQLRPSELYQTRWDDGTEDPDTEVESLLELSKRYLSSFQLQGHYRSKSIELIDFSNQYFYQGRLQLLPHRDVINRPEPAIPKGTITWALDKLDRIFTSQQVRAMDPLYQQVLDTYTYRNSQGNYILCWDNARFINHSSQSNCVTTAYEFEIAVRDIHPGEQLTDDYGYLNLDEPFEAEREEGTDRTTIYPDDLIRYYHIWDEQLLNTFPFLLQVDQPLFKILDPALKEKALSIAGGRERMDSILSCYYPVNGRINGEAQHLTQPVPNVVYPF